MYTMAVGSWSHLLKALQELVNNVLKNTRANLMYTMAVGS